MREPHGYAVTTDAETGRAVEHDVIRCCHCQRIREVPAGPLSTFPWCWACGAPTCQSEQCTARCDPWERQIERSEARDRLFRDVGV